MVKLGMLTEMTNLKKGHTLLYCMDGIAAKYTYTAMIGVYYTAMPKMDTLIYYRVFIRIVLLKAQLIILIHTDIHLHI